jgi:hypothetical protein
MEMQRNGWRIVSTAILTLRIVIGVGTRVKEEAGFGRIGFFFTA